VSGKRKAYQILTNLFTVKILTGYFIFISEWLYVLSAARLLSYQVALSHFSMWQYRLSVQIRWLFAAVWLQVHYWKIPCIILHKVFQELGNIFTTAVIFKPIFYCSWNQNMNHNSDSVNTFFPKTIFPLNSLTYMHKHIVCFSLPLATNSLFLHTNFSKMFDQSDTFNHTYLLPFRDDTPPLNSISFDLKFIVPTKGVCTVVSSYTYEIPCLS